MSTRPPWYQFIGELDWCLNDINYAWAVLVLSGLRDTVLTTRRVSDAQLRALDAIRARVV
jgi:hypothetical protein